MRLTVWSYSGNVLRWQETYRLGICVQTGYADQDSSFGLSAAPWINASDNKLGMTKTGFLFFSSSQYSVFLFLLLSHSVTSNSLQPWGLQPARLLCPWDAPGKNTGVSCHFLLHLYCAVSLNELKMITKCSNTVCYSKKLHTDTKEFITTGQIPFCSLLNAFAY